MRLYDISPVDIESVVARPVFTTVDERGNRRSAGLGGDGRAIIVVVANDDPDFVITAFPED